jgi:hypothetical protein
LFAASPKTIFSGYCAYIVIFGRFTPQIALFGLWRPHPVISGSPQCQSQKTRESTRLFVSAFDTMNIHYSTPAPIIYFSFLFLQKTPDAPPINL